MQTRLMVPRRLHAVAALLAAAVIVTLLPQEGMAARQICPQYLERYCIGDPDGVRSTVWTDPCLAELKHLRILHRGRCRLA